MSSGPRRGKRGLIAILLAGTILGTSGFLLFHGLISHNSNSNITYSTHNDVGPHQLPDNYTIAFSNDAKLVSTQPAAPVCPEEVVELKGSYTISGPSFKTYTTTLNAPVADPYEESFFYSFSVPNQLAKTFNADAARGPVKITVVNLDKKLPSSCNPVSGQITSVSPATPSV